MMRTSTLRMPARDWPDRLIFSEWAGKTSIRSQRFRLDMVNALCDMDADPRQWPAQDWSTALFMERFYENLLGARPGLESPMSKVEALAEAKSYLRGLDRQAAIDRLQALQIPFEDARLVGDRPFAHPFYWASFILIGVPGK